MSKSLGPYVILDVETTGSGVKDSKITEIAIYKHDGEKVIDSYSTLLNPEQRISAFIENFTGITNEMVEGSPTFPMVAKDILQFTEGCVLVAHNSNFDYGMLKSEYSSLGFRFQRNTLCTVKLARKFLPGYDSYSLGKLCKSLGIEIENRHRAGGDAEATVILFEKILAEQEGDSLSKHVLIDAFNVKMHPNLKKESIDNLPDQTGVYYFHDSKGDVIYVGKSKSIRKRVLSHFNGAGTRKHLALRNEASDISYEICGSELIALIFESQEIARLLPRHNSAQKRQSFYWGIYSYTNQNGYNCFLIDRIKAASKPIAIAGSKRLAESMLQSMIRQFVLCPKLCGVDKSMKACFSKQINKCLGACVKEESPEQYNKRTELVEKRFVYQAENFAIIDRGRTKEERSVVLVEDGTYVGYGFAPFDQNLKNASDFQDVVKSQKGNKYIAGIIKTWMNQVQDVDIIAW